MNTGKRFENKIRSWHKDIDCLTFKFPDYASSGSMQKALCDRVTITSKGTYWFECKHTNSKTSFSLSLIKPHQMKSMLRIEELTNKAYFLIEDGFHNVYMIKPSFIKKIKLKSVKFSGLKSVKKHEFHDFICDLSLK
jgi:penicillin-binding protein-related factor A (putative recombinase)